MQIGIRCEKLIEHDRVSTIYCFLGNFCMAFHRFIATCVFLSYSVFSFALYNGSPSLPEMPENGFFLSKDSALAVKTGYEGDFLFGRNFKISSSLSNSGIHSMFNAGVLTLGFVNRAEVYSCLGATQTQVTFTSLHEKIRLKTNQNFGGELGIRANTPIWGDMKFGVDAKYFYAWPFLSQILVGNNTVETVGDVFQREWQIGASISQTFAFFTPYVGVKFSKFFLKYVDLSSLHQWIPSGKVSIHNQSPFGFFVGMGISGKTGIYFDFEARFIDEYAATGALGLSF